MHSGDIPPSAIKGNSEANRRYGRGNYKTIITRNVLPKGENPNCINHSCRTVQLSHLKQKETPLYNLKPVPETLQFNFSFPDWQFVPPSAFCLHSRSIRRSGIDRRRRCGETPASD